MQRHWGRKGLGESKKHTVGNCWRKGLMVFKKWMRYYWATEGRPFDAEGMEIYSLSLFPYIIFRRYFPLSCLLSRTCVYEATKIEITTLRMDISHYVLQPFWLDYLPFPRSQMGVTSSTMTLANTVHTTGITYWSLYSFPLSSQIEPQNPSQHRTVGCQF